MARTAAIASSMNEVGVHVAESVSPAAFLTPGQSLSHRHMVFHFTGDEMALDRVSRQWLGVSLNRIKTVF